MPRRSTSRGRGIEAHVEERAITFRKRQEEAMARRVPIRPEGPRAMLHPYQVS